MRCRSTCIPCEAQCTAEEILQLSSSGSYRCPITNINNQSCMHFRHLICTDRSSSPKDMTRSSPLGSTNCSSMVFPTMVPSSVGESNGLSDPTISKLDTSDLSQGENSSSDQSKQPPTSRLKDFRQNVSYQDVSEETFDLLCSAWRKGTLVKLV